MTKLFTDDQNKEKKNIQEAERKSNNSEADKKGETSKKTNKSSKASEMKKDASKISTGFRSLKSKVKRANKSGTVKIVVIFLAVVLVCTFLSRAASSFITPHIETSRITSQSITHTLYGEAFVEAQKENPVYIYSGVLIDEVMVGAGDEIEAGTELVRYNTDMLSDLYDSYTIQMKMYVIERNETYVKTEINYKIEQLQKEMDEIEKLIENNGILYSDTSGYITNINVTAGEYSTDTAAFYVADSESGYKVVVSVSDMDIEYVDEETSARVVATGAEETCKVSSVVESSTQTGMYDVTCYLSDEGFSAGMSAQVVFTKESTSSGFTVPVESVRADASGAYVLIVGYKDTILGEEMVAKKISVKELDSNDTYAVLSSEALSNDDIVIVNSDKSIEAGDVVRYED